MRSVADAVMGTLARLLVGVFFRDLEVTGRERLPSGGPTMLVANHQNGLVDGLVLMAGLPRHPRFLGKSTLWRILPLRPFLALAGVVPVYRASEVDRGSPSTRTAGNDEAFARCRQLLGAGGMVSIFPEGISHNEPILQQLRTGAARIALGAAGDDGVVGVRIVPAGLVYDNKSRFRSRALVRVGPARAVDTAVAEYRRDSREAVRVLTEEMAADLRAVAPDYRSWEAAEHYALLADLLVRAPGRADRPGLAAREEATRQVAALATAPSQTEVFEAFVAEAAQYRRGLALIGLSDEQLIAGHPTGRYRWLLAWSLAKVIGAAPIAGIGVTVHIVPYSIVKGLACLPKNEGMRATVKVAGCFGLFTLTYAALAVAVGVRRRPRAGLLSFAAAPVSGYVAVLAGERLEAIGGLARGVEVLRRHREGVVALRARRTGLVTQIASWLEAGP